MPATCAARGARARAPAVLHTNPLTAPWSVALSAAVLFTLRLHGASGATACPPESIAGSPNSLTTSRPAPDGSAPNASQCAKAANGTAKAKAKVAAPAAVAAAVTAPAATPAWKSVLDPLPAGGWKYISDGPAENPSAVYASTHSILHNGNVVTAWMRWEFAHPQAEVYPLHYLSAVTREELDCDARSYRRAAVVYYARNNLQEKGPSFTALDDDTTWKQAIPGSAPDAMLSWGCTTAPTVTQHRSSPAKAVAASSSAPVAEAAGGTELHTAR